MYVHESDDCGGGSIAPIRPCAVLKRLIGLLPSVMRVDLRPSDFSSFTCTPEVGGGRGKRGVGVYYYNTYNIYS